MSTANGFLIRKTQVGSIFAEAVDIVAVVALAIVVVVGIFVTVDIVGIFCCCC